MTLQELSQYYKMQEQLRQYKEILVSLESRACPGAQAITGMPHSPGVQDRVGNLAIEIAEIKDQIALLQEKAAAEEERITSFIEAIENTYIRMIFRFRFLHGLTWKEVASVIGGQNSASSVKNTCYRYLEICDAPGAMVLAGAPPNMV